MARVRSCMITGPPEPDRGQAGCHGWGRLTVESAAKSGRIAYRTTTELVFSTRFPDRAAEAFARASRADYSWRSVTAGSARIARAAGTPCAASVTARRTAATPAKVSGSVAVTPKSDDSR